VNFRLNYFMRFYFRFCRWVALVAAQAKKIKICDIYNKIYRAGRGRKFSAPTFPKIYDEPRLFFDELAS
jgi:hypothetical protein